jgi:hypothetical protein
MRNRGFEGSVRVKTELTDWIDDKPIIDRRVIDQFGTELVIINSSPDRFTLLRGFALGDGAGVSVDVSDAPLGEVLTNLLDHYEL